MRESSTYQAILDEGRIEEAQRMILLQGGERFGTSSEAINAALTAITDLERLHRMGVHIFRVSNWEELLATS